MFDLSRFERAIIAVATTVFLLKNITVVHQPPHSHSVASNNFFNTLL